MNAKNPPDEYDDSRPVICNGGDRAFLYDAGFPYGFEIYNTMASISSRLCMIRRAATHLEKNPGSEELEGYLRLVSRAGVLDPDILVRSNAFVCLAELHDGVDLCWLLSGLKDVDADVRAVCVQGIRWIEKKSNAKYLLPLLRDRAVEVRGLVILSVPELLSKPKAAHALYDHLSMEKNPTLRAICYYFLSSKSLADRDLEAKVKMELNAEPQLVRSLTEELKRGKDPDELLAEL